MLVALQSIHNDTTAVYDWKSDPSNHCTRPHLHNNQTAKKTNILLKKPVNMIGNAGLKKVVFI